MDHPLRCGILALAAAAMLLPASLGAAETAYTGVVGDAMCGLKHDMGVADAAKCTRMCAKGGGKYALILGPAKYYELDANATQRAALDKLAGKKATVQGELKGNTITVHTVAPAPASK